LGYLVAVTEVGGVVVAAVSAEGEFQSCAFGLADEG